MAIELRFFFSSRRRHTRFKCDWSSDVCSSDLGRGPVLLAKAAEQRQPVRAGQPPVEQDRIPRGGVQGVPRRLTVRGVLDAEPLFAQTADEEVGNLGLVLNHQDANAHRPALDGRERMLPTGQRLTTCPSCPLSWAPSSLL